MLRVTFRPGLGTEVPVLPQPGLPGSDPAPAPVPSLAMPLMTVEDYARLQGAVLCPHWQRLNLRGNCVDQWWVGPPISWVSAAIVTTAGMALIGWALVVASKIKPLEKTVFRMRKVVKAPTWE
jgi:hypothetical protein